VVEVLVGHHDEVRACQPRPGEVLVVREREPGPEERPGPGHPRVEQQAHALGLDAQPGVPERGDDRFDHGTSLARARRTADHPLARSAYDERTSPRGELESFV
jgi:hypothetical protein